MCKSKEIQLGLFETQRPDRVTLDAIVMPPCPYCNDEPELIRKGDYYWVICMNCFARMEREPEWDMMMYFIMTESHKSPKDAIKDWKETIDIQEVA